MGTFWTYSVVGLCLLLLLVLVIKEMRRANRRWVTARVIASSLAVVSLACIALPIRYKPATPATAAKTILLTPGFTIDSVEAMLKEENALKVYYLDDMLAIPASLPARFVASPAWLNDSILGESPLHIYGEGLSADALAILDNRPVVFHPAAPQSGIASIYWPQTISAGEPLKVQGSYVNTTGHALKLVLSGFSTPLDSIAIAPKTTTRFSLGTVPKHSGRVVYTIASIKGSDTVEREPLPVDVETVLPPQFLFLTSAPSFDNNFLKNWIAEKGFGIAMRTTISTNKYAKAFLNTPAVSLDRITPAMLSRFDAVIADALAYRALSAQEKNALLSMVDQQGMGLLIKADSSIESSLLNRNFPVVASAQPNMQQVKLHLADSANHLPDLAIEQPLYLRTVQGTQPLVFDKQLHAFASTILYGSGKILVTTVSNTYQWVLSGKKLGYNQFWAALLNKVAKTEIKNEQWSAPVLVRRDERAPVSVQAAPGAVPMGQVGSHSFYLQQYSMEPTRWTGWYWPINSGWQAGIQTNGTSYSWYVFGPNDYPNIRVGTKVNATQLYARQHPLKTSAFIAANNQIEVEFPTAWFVALFVCCCTFLWVEKKLR